MSSTSPAKVGTDETGRVVGRTMREQTACILDGIKALVEREGGTMEDIVRVRVFVTTLDAASLREVHEVRARCFSEGHYPASTLVRVSQLIPDGGLIEIDGDAVIQRQPQFG